jgi:hypothetical protein
MWAGYSRLVGSRRIVDPVDASKVSVFCTARSIARPLR